MATPYYTSDDLIAAVKRKIAVPLSEETFSENDILQFANEETAIAQVPQVLSYHEEYFVVTESVPLVANQTRYPIPDRAIGMRLRNLFYLDSNNNPFEMNRVASDDKAFFQNNNSGAEFVYRYYLEGNDVVLTNKITAPTGNLQFSYYLRPNQLVATTRAAIISSFGKPVQCVNANLSNGDTITVGGIVFTAVSGSPSVDEFQIGASSSITAANLANTISTNGIANASSSSDTTVITYSDRNLVFETSSPLGLDIAEDRINLNCTTNIPSNITDLSLVDLLQTKAGHKTRAFDILVPSNGVSGQTLQLEEDDVPTTMVIGDYIASANECIIPQIPSDLHVGLAERTCARILSSLGDQQGLGITNSKIQEIEAAQNPLLGQRVDGSAKKVFAKNTLLRRGKNYGRD